MKFKKNKFFNNKAYLKGGDTFDNSSKNSISEIDAIEAKPIEVIVYNNSFDKALRAFRSIVQKERILSLYKEKQTYEKPSDKKRRKRAEAKRKQFEVFSKMKSREEEL